MIIGFRTCTNELIDINVRLIRQVYQCGSDYAIECELAHRIGCYMVTPETWSGMRVRMRDAGVYL